MSGGKQIFNIPNDIFELQLESELQTEELLQHRMRYPLDPLNNSPTVFAMNVADDENDNDNHEPDQVLQLNSDVKNDLTSEESEEVKCEDIFEECDELNLNDFFKDDVEDRPYDDIADLTQAQEEYDQYASHSLVCCLSRRSSRRDHGSEPCARDVRGLD